MYATFLRIAIYAQGHNQLCGLYLVPSVDGQLLPFKPPTDPPIFIIPKKYSTIYTNFGSRILAENISESLRQKLSQDKIGRATNLKQVSARNFGELLDIIFPKSWKNSTFVLWQD